MNESGYSKCPKCGSSIEFVSYCETSEVYSVDSETGDCEELPIPLAGDNLGEIDWMVDCIGDQLGEGESCNWQVRKDEEE